jgi:RNA polymerase sigma-70 factor, ECF subfamily
MDNTARQAALELARQGDARALGELLQSFRPYLRAVVRTFQGEDLQSQIDDSDLIQDTLVEVHRSFPGFQGETVAEFVAWIRRIALRSAARTAGKLKGSSQAETVNGLPQDGAIDLVPDPGSTPSAQVIRQELASRITDELAKLPKDMQLVLLGRLVDGLPHAAIAERLNRSEEAVRMLYVRALSRLRDCCQNLDSGPPLG